MPRLILGSVRHGLSECCLAMFTPAERLVEHGRWPNDEGVWGVILGRRRVATVPQAMLNMAFGQMPWCGGVWRC